MPRPLTHRHRVIHGRGRGVYTTSHGTRAIVAGPEARTAYDLDCGRRIPIEDVTRTKLRDVTPDDIADRYNSGFGGAWEI